MKSSRHTGQFLSDFPVVGSSRIKRAENQGRHQVTGWSMGSQGPWELFLNECKVCVREVVIIQCSECIQGTQICTEDDWHGGKPTGMEKNVPRRTVHVK